MKRASNRGFVLTMEAFFSLLVALMLLSFIPLTYGASKFSRASLLFYQQANDVAEVLWAAGDYGRIGDWIEGDEAAGYVVGERIGEIARGTDSCIILEAMGKRIGKNCEGKETETVAISRTVIGEKGIYEMLISVS